MVLEQDAALQKHSDGDFVTRRPHIVLIIPRGDAVRNFLYSDTLPTLAEQAHVTLLSVIHDEAFTTRFSPFVDRIIPLQEYDETKLVHWIRILAHNVHFRWLWSGVARNRFEMYDALLSKPQQKILRWLWKRLVWGLANRPILEVLTALERRTTWVLRPTRTFDRLFDELQPDLVFNTSHIHGPASSLPMRVAYKKGICTAGFIFSWDNLTSRSRIFVPYHYYLVWHKRMRDEFLGIYTKINPDYVIVTGTPQFDFHFNPKNFLTREALADYVGFDPSRPFLLYTTGIDHHFPDEHRMVQAVIDFMQRREIDFQLVVRTYFKGTSREMLAIRDRQEKDVYFPLVQWDKQGPTSEDQRLYSTMLRECSLGINAASTVSLELMMHRKPVINLGFDPPGSKLPTYLRWSKHIDEFDHYIPVRDSGAVLVARSVSDLETMIKIGIREPDNATAKQQKFLQWMFGDMLDGGSGKRVANCLLHLAGLNKLQWHPDQQPKVEFSLIDQQPQISVVIPTFNRANNLYRCLRLLQQQTLTAFEVIIVDNGPSTDRTNEILEEICREDPRFFYIRTSERGAFVSRNIGCEQAEGNIVLTIDDDWEMVDRQSLDYIVDCFRISSDLGVLGLQHDYQLDLQISNGARKIILWLRRFLVLHFYQPGRITRWGRVATKFYYLPKDTRTQVDHVQSFCMAFRKDIAEQVGFFPNVYSEGYNHGLGYRAETELCRLIADQGYKIESSSIVTGLHVGAARPKSVITRSVDTETVQYQSRNHTLFMLRNYWSTRTALLFLIFDIILGNKRQPGIIHLFTNPRFLFKLQLVRNSIRGKVQGYRIYLQKAS